MSRPLSTWGLLVSKKGPTRTVKGEPYTRFARLDQDEVRGYYAIGERLIEECPAQETKFWERLFFSMAVEGNMAWDAAHTLDTGLCAGAVGFTGDRLVELLGLCFTLDATCFIESLGPAFADVGVYLSKQSGSWVLHNKQRRAVGLNDILAGQWTTRRKEFSRRWTSCVSDLFSNKQFDEMQLIHLQTAATGAVSDLLATSMKWPKRGAVDAWTFSAEQRVLWSILLAVSLDVPRIAESLIATSRADTALETLRNINNNQLFNKHIRYQNILQHLLTYERITLE